MKTIRTLAVAILSTAGVIACASTDQTPIANTPVSETTVTSQNNADRSVVERLAAARCNQELTCDNIGPGAKFDSRRVCMDKMRGDIGNDFTAYKCPRGLNADAVNRCIQAIESEECSHPFDTITRFDKCRTSAICMD